ncbi:hypothetical protein ACE7GA_18065 [Roseomonas sp. CCTCC AB2023176]|uniref:hypothetical protein n=1 Tax=Roseomonas sp. CCTCC AB2023176 TaxID=3342640 RepID=UPI0035E1B2F3
MDDASTLALLLDRVVGGRASRPDTETTAAMLAQARRFATGVLAPLAPGADRMGCSLRDCGVATPPGYRDGWRAYAKAGWAGLTAPEPAAPEPAATGVAA